MSAPNLPVPVDPPAPGLTPGELDMDDPDTWAVQDDVGNWVLPEEQREPGD